MFAVHVCAGNTDTQLTGHHSSWSLWDHMCLTRLILGDTLDATITQAQAYLIHTHTRINTIPAILGEKFTLKSESYLLPIMHLKLCFMFILFSF